MSCNCGKRAASLLGWLGFIETGSAEQPAVVFRSERGAMVFLKSQVDRYHFRIALLSLIARLMLGKEIT